MALNDIIEAIRLETEAEIEAIEQEAADQAAAIAADGRRKAAAVEAELAAARDDEAATEENRIRNGARLEADRELRVAREAIVQGILDDVAQRLHGLRSSADYPGILRRLAHEASSVLPAGTVIHIDPRDGDDLDGLFDGPMEVVGDLSTGGGLLLASPDGRRVHNTFEVRLERAVPHMRHLIAERIPELGARPS